MFPSRRRVVVVQSSQNSHHRTSNPLHPSSRQQCPTFRRSRRRHTRHRRHGFLHRGLSVMLTSAMLHRTSHAQQDSDGIPGPNETYVPLRVTNNCGETIWPGIGTQHGLGPGLGGFELVPGETLAFLVGPTWQGRVWGRTNCSFNEAGTGPSNLNGWDGGGKACMTGDCFGVVDCEFSGATPVTLAEFNLRGGYQNSQTFYDISLVDGYNLPPTIVYIPAPNTTNIPPNLTNPSCVGTAGFLWSPSRTGETYSNATYPTPWESRLTNQDLTSWCPWDLQVYPPSKPGDGVYPYPDDRIQRPVFDPCLSACAATNDPANCCTGPYNDPKVCKPSLYSEMAKAVCPDAYSFAFDDQTSTFIIPAGGGWEVVFCPAGRSTDILRTFGEQLSQVASGGGRVSKAVDDAAKNRTFIMTHGSGAAASGLGKGMGVVVGLVAVLTAFVVLAG